MSIFKSLFSNHETLLEEQQVKKNLSKCGLEIGDEVLSNNVKSQITSFMDNMVITQDENGRTFKMPPTMAKNCRVKNFPTCQQDY